MVATDESLLLPSSSTRHAALGLASFPRLSSSCCHGGFLGSPNSCRSLGPDRSTVFCVVAGDPSGDGGRCSAVPGAMDCGVPSTGVALGPADPAAQAWACCTPRKPLLRLRPSPGGDPPAVRGVRRPGRPGSDARDCSRAVTGHHHGNSSQARAATTGIAVARAQPCCPTFRGATRIARTCAL